MNHHQPDSQDPDELRRNGRALFWYAVFILVAILVIANFLDLLATAITGR